MNKVASIEELVSLLNTDQILPQVAKVANIEVECRYNDATIADVKQLLTGKSFEIEQQVDLISRNQKVPRQHSTEPTLVKRMLFGQGVQQKDRATCYKKSKLIENIPKNTYRVGVSTETMVDNIASFTYNEARVKLRFSYKFDAHWKVDISCAKHLVTSDMTLIKVYKDKMLKKYEDNESMLAEVLDGMGVWKEVTYEIELEYTADPLSITAADFDTADKFMKTIGKYSGGYTETYGDIVYELATYIKPEKSAMFREKADIKRLGNQPLEINKFIYLSEVKTRIADYYITDKIDGQRAIVYIKSVNGSPNIYVLTDKLEIIPVDDIDKSVFGNYIYIFDTEMYEGSYYIFDVLYYESEPLMRQKFESRLSYFEDVSKLHKLFKCKPFIKLDALSYKSQITGLKETKKPYETDGFILTPVGYDYNSMTVYKYKPLDKLTVDFLMMRCPTGGLLGTTPYLAKGGMVLYILFCGIQKNVYMKLSMKLIKSYGMLFPNVDIRNSKYFPIQFEPSDKKFAHLYWHPETEDLHEQIGEFNYISGEWKLHRVREDRQVMYKNGTYFGNNYKVAELTWVNYNCPLVIESDDDDDSYFKTADSQIHKASRSFNSFVKSSIYNNFKDTENVFDMASGKGQDFNRSAMYGFKNVLFTDIDRIAMIGLIMRKHDFANAKSYNKTGGMKVFTAINKRPGHVSQADNNMHVSTQIINFNDLTSRNIKTIDDNVVTPAGGYDLIVCNFAFHYFAGSEKSIRNIIKIVSHYLKKGGRFIFTAFDGLDVLKLLRSNNTRWDATASVPETYTSDDDSESEGVQVTEIKQTKQDTSSNPADLKFSIIGQFADYNTLEAAGQKIKVLLPFSNNAYYYEYLVNIDYISGEFEKHGMVLETNKSFRDFQDKYKVQNPNEYKNMDENDKIYTGLYHYYTFFKKV